MEPTWPWTPIGRTWPKFQIPEGTFGTSTKSERIPVMACAVSNPRRNVWNFSTSASTSAWITCFKSQKERLERPAPLPTATACRRFKSQKERLEHAWLGGEHGQDTGVSNPRRNVWNRAERIELSIASCGFQIPEGTFGTANPDQHLPTRNVFQIPEGTFGTTTIRWTPWSMPTFQIPEGTFGTQSQRQRGWLPRQVSNPRRNVWNLGR